MKRKNELLLNFSAVTLLVLFANIASILFFTFFYRADNNLLNAINVSSIVISFFGFTASFFFSLAIFIQTKGQAEINSKLPNKDDQYIIQNYSLFDFTQEMTVLIPEDPKSIECLSIGRNTNEISQIVFLVSETKNQPTYQVFCKTIVFGNNEFELIYKPISSESINTHYAQNILNRGYNTIAVNFDEPHDYLIELLDRYKKIQITLSIVSIFNVEFEITYTIKLDNWKDVSNNPDIKLYPELKTIFLHHSRYIITGKKIAS